MSAAKRRGRQSRNALPSATEEAKRLSDSDTLRPESATQPTAAVYESAPYRTEMATDRLTSEELSDSGHMPIAPHWFSVADAPARPASTLMRKVDDKHAKMAELMEERFGRDDYDGALVLASTIAYARPDHARANLVKRACSEVLKHKSTAQLASPMSIPERTVSWDDLSKYTLSREEIFMLTFIDGKVSLDTVFDMTAASPEIAYTAFRRLLSLELVTLLDPAKSRA